MFSLNTNLFILFLCVVIVGFSYAKTAGYFESFIARDNCNGCGLSENIKLN
jgi:hypothetical protein